MRFLSAKCPPKFYWFYPEIASIVLFSKVFIVLILLQPFELDRFTFDVQLYLSMIFSIIAGGTYYLSFLIMVNYLDENWTIGKDLLWANSIFLIVAVMVFWFFGFLDGKIEVEVQLEPPVFTDVLKYSFTIGWVMYYLIFSTDRYLMKFALLLKLKKNKKIQEKFEKRPLQVEPEKQNSLYVRLLGKNKEDVLELNPMDIVFIEARGNYVEVNYKSHSNEIKKKVLRTSIIELQVQLNSFTYLYNCHRSYIVNLYTVIEMTGTLKSKKAVLRCVNELYNIPISRLKMEEFNNMIEAYNTSILV
ncbi:LytTR family DNA-binding domain-containing protein [Reichenbachiella sp. MALMAid0571]|uniref:LytTR family DNA-binding domain-containing protein n=1 Tax=Reichenbachiella sp. MALMAid0571 TaxID=3143939 RepID=UPI0032DF0FE8